MAEDGQAYLPISDAMGRDLDSGKATGRDVTDFLPDAVAQELYDASHPGPVHAENLIPISKAEAAERTRFDGETMPAFPTTRRVIPAPFQRTRVTGGSHGKAWTLVLARKIMLGDIITEVGLVVDVQEVVQYDERPQAHTHGARLGTVEGCPGCFPPAIGREYVVTGKGGNVKTYAAGAEVKVFRKKE